MENTHLIEVFASEIKNSNCDFKPEPAFLLASERGLFTDEFIISCDKLFHREYSKDIYSLNEIEDGRKQQTLQVNLSRAGIYDQLPEGLFFQLPHGTEKPTQVGQMAAYYKLNKKKEEEIRRFFLPFENDFFRQRLMIEDEETALLEGLQSGILTEYFISFWNLPSSIPKRMLVSLIRLLPYAYKVSGNLELTAQCLEQILGEKVEMAGRIISNAEIRDIDAPLLGEAQLGRDMICGNAFREDNAVVEISIGPLQNSNVSDYLQEGSRWELVETFNKFFIPLEEDIIVNIIPAPEKSYMVTNSMESILGYSTVLG
jgi:hypothetical protein